MVWQTIDRFWKVSDDTKFHDNHLIDSPSNNNDNDPEWIDNFFKCYFGKANMTPPSISMDITPAFFKIKKLHS